MKLSRNIGLLVLAAAGAVGAAGVVSAQTTGDSTSTAAPTQGQQHQGHKWHGHHGGLLLGVTLRATKQLNLTAEQQASIKTILSYARTQAKAARASGESLDMTVLGNPGDPNYATALQSAKTLAASRIQTQSELQAQIYNVLTAQQKAQLPAVLASMKAQAEQHRAAWEQRHAASSDAG